MSDCQKHQGRIDPNGYGVVRIGAHRLAWIIANGRDVPEGHVIHHTCHNRPCIEPDHLVAVPHRENVREGWEAGRESKKGSAHGMAKLDEWGAVGVMAELLMGQKSQLQVGRERGLTNSAVSRLWRGETWRHLFQATQGETANGRRI